jgi:L-arabinokinase
MKRLTCFLTLSREIDIPLFPLCRQINDFDILEGDLHGLADTALFLRTLARLDEEGDVRASDLAKIPQERERLAAGGLFRWEV